MVENQPAQIPNQNQPAFHGESSEAQKTTESFTVPPPPKKSRNLKSKWPLLIIVVLLVLLIPLGGYFVLSKTQKTEPTSSPSPEPVACAQEAMLCPDGKTYVSRQGPKCEFAPCPGS